MVLSYRPCHSEFRKGISPSTEQPAALFGIATVPAAGRHYHLHCARHTIVGFFGQKSCFVCKALLVIALHVAALRVIARHWSASHVLGRHWSASFIIPSRIVYHPCSPRRINSSTTCYHSAFPSYASLQITRLIASQTRREVLIMGTADVSW